MPVIKAEQAPQLGAFSMADIERQAKATIIAARLRAERLIQAAQEEAENLKRQAHAQALVDGKKEGIAKGLEEGKKLGRDEALNEQRQALAQALTAMTQAADELNASRLHLESEARTAVIQLAIAIAERVTKRRGTLDPTLAQANVDEALRLVVTGTDIRIAIHPSQKDTLADTLPRLQAEWSQFKHIDLIADGTLTPGGCRIFTQSGQIDADLNLQLQKIAEDLLPTPNDDAP
jgi:flagellar assembly protein FliH